MRNCDTVEHTTELQPSLKAACLKAAISAGGKVRVGFENSVYMADGSIASDNAARVREAASFMADA